MGQPDLLALLEASRRYADRISVFCQAGRIVVPRPEQPLYPYLEGSVFEVAAPRPGGLFHPKLWLLRMTGDDVPIRYRLLCLSRNLTFDRSWDVLLALEGDLVERKNAIALNHPLGDLLEALPRFAIRAVPQRVLDRVDQIQREVRRVRWELPNGFESLRFWPLGIGGNQRGWPFDGDIRRMLVVSPFVGDGLLSELSAAGAGNILVSRLEDLQRMEPTTLQRFDEVLVLNDCADLDAQSADVESSDEAGQSTATKEPTTLRGLHAKAYVADAGWHARVWVGSANATSRAFDGNVELLVELEGKKSRCGVDAVMGAQKGVTTFRDILTPFATDLSPLIDEEQDALDRSVDGLRYEIARNPMTVRVTEGEGGRFLVEVSVAREPLPSPPPGVRLRCWPIRLQGAVHGTTIRARSGTLARFELAKEELTSFFAFEIVAQKGERSSVARFTLNLPLEGAPADRRESILRSVLSDPDRVLRFLLFLLADSELRDVSGLLSGADEEPSGSGDRRLGFGQTLLESLLSALSRSPGKVDEVARLIEDLRGPSDGNEVLPEGFDEIWQPIEAARRDMR